MNSNDYQYIFGPVPSRRLGHSLGVELITYKICSYDCIYCQLGRTTEKTIKRKEYVPVDVILKELKSKLDEDNEIDYITLSGSGEPTLHSEMGEIIRQIKSITKIPVAVLTNGSMLWMPEVIEDLKSADLVVPSLDAGNSITFQKINRPCSDLSFTDIVQGLADFCSAFKNKVWLEVFLLNQINNSAEEINNIVEICDNLKVDKIHLNTVTRPPCESYCQGLSKIELLEVIPYFDKKKVEIISDFDKIFTKNDIKIKECDIINLLKRRPCTLDDIAHGLNIHKNEAIKYLEFLEKEKKIKLKRQKNEIYYYSEYYNEDSSKE